MDKDLFLKAGLFYIGKGISVMPILQDKKPPFAWKKYQYELPSKAQIAEWAGQFEIGIITGKLSNLAVIDCESKEDAEWFAKKHDLNPRLVVQTRRGYHFYYKWTEGVGNAAGVQDETGRPRYDVRGEGGFVVAPPSVIKGHKYDTVVTRGFDKLPVLQPFDPRWCPEQNGSPSKKYTDGVAYIQKIEAVSGSGGHNATWRAVNTLKDSGLSETEALAAMVEWNETNCHPQWSVPDLLHKVSDAYSRA